jgi:hypothetical protein
MLRFKQIMQLIRNKRSGEKVWWAFVKSVVSELNQVTHSLLKGLIPRKAKFSPKLITRIGQHLNHTAKYFIRSVLKNKLEKIANNETKLFLCQFLNSFPLFIGKSKIRPLWVNENLHVQ